MGAFSVYSRTGHLIYQTRETRGGLWALPFSLGILRTTGEAIPIAQNAFYPSLASDVTLVYLEQPQLPQRQLVWRDRKGKKLGGIGEPQPAMEFPSLSPARSADHRQGDAFDEDGDDQEGAAEQSEDAEGEERAQDAILEGRRRAESAELGGDPNGDVDSDQRSDDPEGRRVVDPGGADQGCGGEDARQPGEEDVFGRSQSGFERGEDFLHEFGVLPGC